MSKFLISLQRLDDWFHHQKRILPWRSQPTFYRVWVSEIMLQQTQVVTVIPYFERFIERFPTLQDLAEACLEDVLGLWAGLGYYSRARNLHRGAKMIADQGKFPKTRAGWLEIPGVGEYTAGAILSIAGNQPEPILDANVERVLSRIKRVSRAKGDTEFKTRLWKISRSFVEKGYKHQMNPSQLNQALMELGALICTPTKPRCLLCPLVDLCEASKKGDTDAFPPKKPPKEWLKVKENMHCVIFEAQWVLLRQRVKGEWRAGLWDLLEKNPGEFISNLNRVGQVETRHTVTRHKIDRKTDIWQVASKKHEIGEYRWVSVRAPEVPVGSALKKTLKAVEQVLMDRK